MFVEIEGQKRVVFSDFFAVFSPRKIDFLICSKKNGVFLCKNGLIENQALTNTIFSLENAPKKAVFFGENRRFARTKRRSILPKGRFTKIIRRFAMSKMSICRNRVSICGVFVGSLRVGSRFSSLFCELSASFYRFLSH